MARARNKKAHRQSKQGFSPQQTQNKIRNKLQAKSEKKAKHMQKRTFQQTLASQLKEVMLEDTLDFLMLGYVALQAW